MTSSKKHERVLKWTNRIGGVPQAAPDWLHPNGSRAGLQCVTVGGEEESERDAERAGGTPGGSQVSARADFRASSRTESE